MNVQDNKAYFKKPPHAPMKYFAKKKSEAPQQAPPEVYSLYSTFLYYAEKRRKSLRKLSGLTHVGKVYSTHGYFRTIFIGFRQRCLADIWHVILFVLLYSTALTCLVEYDVLEIDFAPAGNDFAFFAITTTLSLLLAFRAQRASVRWWDSRIMWGKIVFHSRNVGSRLVGHFRLCESRAKLQNGGPLLPESAESVEIEELRTKTAQFLIQMVTYSITTRNYLRKQKPLKNKDDYVGLGLTDAELQKIDDANHIVTTTVITLRDLLNELVPPCATDFYAVRLHSSIADYLDDFCLVSGGLERILNSPLPTVWTSNLRTFLLFYFLLMPFQLLASVVSLTLSVARGSEIVLFFSHH
jgi:predicted membrane chloride channel (bestrophin family)